MIEEFKDVLHPMQVLGRKEPAPVFPCQSLHKSKIKDLNGSKHSSQGSTATPVFNAEALLAP
jgi:hypothetical protein